MNYLELYILAAFFVTTYGNFLDVSVWEDNPEECGRTRFENTTLDVADYSKARVGQFPWVAMIGSIHPDNQILFFCGGSLISKSYVISEAQCGRLGQLVRLGSIKAEDTEEEKDCDECGECALPPQDIKVRKQIFGNDCSLNSVQRIIILELEKPAEYNDFVRPICIPTDAFCHTSRIRQRALTPGFGHIFSTLVGVTERKEKFDDMRYVNSAIVTQEECNAIYPDLLKDGEFCVDYPKGVNHSCVGDTGGPLVEYLKVKGVARAFLIGVAKINPLICEAEDTAPIVYSSVCNYSEWISNQIVSSIEAERKQGRRLFAV
ncbi:trypsin-3-like [Anoplophora glabripennis]|uniref:trypsin-3-like n=1 Tax=Anoplophora glabripennis TaxID=217634 RepID=UPI000873AF47|nr:trypsin-3-like [Anoplophora glabripennis]